MVDIPKKYNQDIQKMIDWHLSVYMEEKELSYLKECASDAVNYADECGINKDTLWRIADWAQEEREKYNV